MSPYEIDIVVTFISSDSPPESAFEHTFDKVAVVTRPDIKLIPLVGVVDCFRSEHK